MADVTVMRIEDFDSMGHEGLTGSVRRRGARSSPVPQGVTLLALGGVPGRPYGGDGR
jgi:hypothetical protein